MFPVSAVFFTSQFNPYEWEQAVQERHGYLRGKKVESLLTPQPSNHPLFPTISCCLSDHLFNINIITTEIATIVQTQSIAPF